MGEEGSSQARWAKSSPTESTGASGWAAMVEISPMDKPTHEEQGPAYLSQSSSVVQHDCLMSSDSPLQANVG